MNRFVFILAVAFTLLPAIVEAADIRLKVKNSTLGSERKGDTRKSQRQLEIEIDNRDREDYEGVTLEWVVIARDIRNRKLSIASRGSKQIDIPADDEIEVTSSPYSFQKKKERFGRSGKTAFAPTGPSLT